MIVLAPEQIQALGGVALHSAIDKLCLFLLDVRQELSGTSLDVLRLHVERCVNEGVAVGLTSKADIYTYVEFCLFDYPGFNKSKEFLEFVSRKTDEESQKMLNFIHEVHPLYWRRYAKRALLSNGGAG